MRKFIKFIKITNITKIIKILKDKAVYFYIALTSVLLLLLTTCALTPSNSHIVEFQNNICIEPHNSYSYLTCHDLLVRVDNEIIRIPQGFETDLASIPRVYWSILSPAYAHFIKPAILHDYLYRCKNKHTRLFADEVLYYSLVSEDVSEYTAKKFYGGVRLFGSSSYIKQLTC